MALLLKDINVCLLNSSAQPLLTSAEEKSGKDPTTSTSNATSCHLTAQAATSPGEPFQVMIESNTPWPAGIPLDCEALRINVLVGGNVVIESGEVEVADDGSIRIVLGGEELRFASVEPSQYEDARLEEEDSSRAIEVQLVPCRRRIDRNPGTNTTTTSALTDPTTTTEVLEIEPIPNRTLLYTFHPRPSPASQRTETHPAPTLQLHDPRSPPCQYEENTMTTTDSFQTSEYNLCCGRILPGAPPDPITGRIPHTGIIVCSNEWCQRRGQAWHKSCAGLEIWEEPEGVWLCPECRVRPEAEMEVWF